MVVVLLVALVVAVAAVLVVVLAAVVVDEGEGDGVRGRRAGISGYFNAPSTFPRLPPGSRMLGSVVGRERDGLSGNGGDCGDGSGSGVVNWVAVMNGCVWEM